MAQPETNPAVEPFIERMGLSAQADGLPRIAGRMWGFFIIYAGPCSFAELADRLQVSRGSISTNARILRDLGFIERVSRPGDRQDYYRLADEPYARLLEGYVERMRQTARNVADARAEIPDDWRDAQRRLAEMHDFYQAGAETTRELIEALRATKQPAQPQA